MSKSGKNILQGIKNDNERLDNAYAALEDTIRKGRKKTFLKSEDASLDRPVALKYICDYMGIEAPSFDPYSLNSEAYITEVLRKNGVLSRPCVLTEGWYRNAVCVYLIELDGGRLAALMPDSFGRYYYHDLVTGHRVFINKFNCCFSASDRSDRDVSAHCQFAYAWFRHTGKKCGNDCITGCIFNQQHTGKVFYQCITEPYGEPDYTENDDLPSKRFVCKDA